MWWSRALLVCSILALGPVGCGFQPIYAQSQAAAPVSNELSGVRVGRIEDRLGQQLRNALVSRISPTGEPSAPRHVLSVELRQTVEGLAANRTGHATLARLSITAIYHLSDAADDAARNPADERSVLISGASRSVVSFRMLGPRYGSVAAERDAEERAITEVAEDIRSQLAARFAAGLDAPRLGR